MVAEQTKVHVKIFPAAGLCNQKTELEIELEEGSLSELMVLLGKRLGADLEKMERLMFLHNGFGLDRRENTVFQDGDQLWLLPWISGG